MGNSNGPYVMLASAKGLFPADLVLGEVDLRWPGAGLSGCKVAKGTVWPGSVVLRVFGQHQAQMVLIYDQEPVNWPAQSLIRNFSKITHWPDSSGRSGLLASSTRRAGSR